MKGNIWLVLQGPNAPGLGRQIVSAPEQTPSHMLALLLQTARQCLVHVSCKGHVLPSPTGPRGAGPGLPFKPSVLLTKLLSLGPDSVLRVEPDL